MKVESYENIIDAIPDDDVKTATEELDRALDTSVHLSELRDTYESPGTTLVLGAGVSVSCGAPNWPELLLRLHNVATSRQWSVDLSSLSGVYAEAIGSTGPLISARLAASGLDDESPEFRENLRKEIYRNVDKETRSDLVQQLARLAQQCEGREGVQSILTYNYDTLLEEEFEHLGRNYRRLDRNDKGSAHGIELRHVHGFLGRTPLEGEWVVLTEQGYHTEYAAPFSWSNIVQLNAFRESSCLFVGLSMTDPNLRRLLEAAQQSATPRHFCFLRRTSGAALHNSFDATWATRGRGKGRPSGTQNEQVERRFELIARMVDSNRASGLEQLGVSTVWYNEHRELPAIIEEIRSPAKK